MDDRKYIAPLVHPCVLFLTQPGLEGWTARGGPRWVVSARPGWAGLNSHMTLVNSTKYNMVEPTANYIKVFSPKFPLLFSARILLIIVGSIPVEVRRARSSEILAASTWTTVSASLRG